MKREDLTVKYMREEAVNPPPAGDAEFRLEGVLYVQFDNPGVR